MKTTKIQGEDVYKRQVSAAVKQIEDIEFIRDTVGFESLPDGLAQIAKARLLKPEATLKELGEDLEPPVGKSGVNHRLRKLEMCIRDRICTGICRRFPQRWR